jgi:peptidoglycan hydrolase CwlO-like protein
MKNVIVEQSLDFCLNEINETLKKQEENLTNHVEHINKDISVININVASLNNKIGEVKTDVEWIKKIGFMLFASMLALIGGIILNVI